MSIRLLARRSGLIGRALASPASGVLATGCDNTGSADGVEEAVAPGVPPPHLPSLRRGPGQLSGLSLSVSCR
jgi:hypothetical protein